MQLNWGSFCQIQAPCKLATLWFTAPAEPSENQALKLGASVGSVALPPFILS